MMCFYHKLQLIMWLQMVYDDTNAAYDVALSQIADHDVALHGV